ncbi:Protein GES-1, partial [Aphelenchoides avenae]
VFPPPSIGRLLALSPEKQTSFGAEDFERFVAKEVGTKETFGANLELVRKQIVDFYTQADNASQVKDAAFYVKRYTELCSDLQFNIPVLQEIFAKAVSDWPIIAYLNTHLSGRELTKPPNNVVTHLYDHNFIFRGGNQLKSLNFTDEDEAVSSFLIAALVSFVKTG